MARIYIDDKLTLKAEVQPKRVNPETGRPEPDDSQPVVKISFRPPLSSTLMLYLDESPLTTPAAKIEALHKFLDAHLVDWDVEDHAGNKVPKEIGSMPHIPSPYLNAMEMAIIEGSTKVRAVEKN